jgi:hypothetical protein
MNIQRALLTAAGLVAFTVAGLALIARYLPITNHAVFLTAALSPYLTLCAPVSMALLVPISGTIRYLVSQTPTPIAEANWHKGVQA